MLLETRSRLLVDLHRFPRDALTLPGNLLCALIVMVLSNHAVLGYRTLQYL